MQPNDVISTSFTYDEILMVFISLCHEMELVIRVKLLQNQKTKLRSLNETKNRNSQINSVV